MSTDLPQTPEVTKPASQTLLWFALIFMAMGGLACLYYDAQNQYKWAIYLMLTFQTLAGITLDFYEGRYRRFWIAVNKILLLGIAISIAITLKL